jgi:hypothetical protein
LDFVHHPVFKRLENNILETGTVSETCFLVSGPHLRMEETDPVSEMLCFLVSRILDDGESPRTQ